MSVDALVGEEGDLVFNSECDGEPVKGFQDGGDVVIFAHPHQDPGSAVLYVLELLDALARDNPTWRIQRCGRASLHLPG